MTVFRQCTAKAISALVVLCLAACGGSSTGGGVIDDGPDTSVIDDFLQANGQLRGAAQRATEAQVAALGTASYAGAFDARLDGADLAAVVNVAVDLGTSSADVTMSDFTQGLSGQLTGEGTVIADAPSGVPQFIVTTEGTLNRSGTALVSQIALDGTFLQDGTDAVGALAGQAEGTVGDQQIRNGRFVVSR